MKHLINKISASKSNIISHIKMGSDTFNVVTRDGSVKGVLNGYEILTLKKAKNSDEKLAYVLKDIFGTFVKKANPNSISVINGVPEGSPDLRFLDKLMPYLKEEIGAKNVSLKKAPKDMEPIRETLTPDFKIEKALNYEDLIHNLRVFNKRINSISQVLATAKNSALMLTRGKLVASMWGAKTTQKVLDTIRDELSEDATLWSKVDLYNEMITKSVERLNMKLRTDLIKTCKEEQKMVSSIIIPSILVNYDNLKSLVIKAAVTIAPLVYIDEAFMRLTSYPAKFFMSEDLLDALKRDYDNIVSFIASIPNIEAKVIDPVSFVKMQFMGK